VPSFGSLLAAIKFHFYFHIQFAQHYAQHKPFDESAPFNEYLILVEQVKKVEGMTGLGWGRIVRGGTSTIPSLSLFLLMLPLPIIATATMKKVHNVKAFHYYLYCATAGGAALAAIAAAACTMIRHFHCFQSLFIPFSVLPSSLLRITFEISSNKACLNPFSIHNMREV